MFFNNIRVENVLLPSTFFLYHFVGAVALWVDCPPSGHGDWFTAVLMFQALGTGWG